MKPVRKNTINLLKQKITALQSQLTVMQSKNDRLQTAHSPHRITLRSSPYNSPYNRQYKSPTFWNKNPITHEDKYSPTQSRTPSPSPLREVQRNVSPPLVMMRTNLDRNYYGYSSNMNIQPEISPQKKHSYVGKRFQHSRYGEERSREESKESKIRTYEQRRNTIAENPEKEKTIGVKMVVKKDKSPDNMFTSHPNSSKRMYCFSNNQAFVLHQKGGVKPDKNKSLIQLHSSLGEVVPIKFDENVAPKRKKSQRKHLVQHFRDNFCSHFQFE